MAVTYSFTLQVPLLLSYILWRNVLASNFYRKKILSKHTRRVLLRLEAMRFARRRRQSSLLARYTVACGGCRGASREGLTGCGLARMRIREKGNGRDSGDVSGRTGKGPRLPPPSVTFYYPYHGRKRYTIIDRFPPSSRHEPRRLRHSVSFRPEVYAPQQQSPSERNLPALPLPHKGNAYENDGLPLLLTGIATIRVFNFPRPSKNCRFQLRTNLNGKRKNDLVGSTLLSFAP